MPIEVHSNNKDKPKKMCFKYNLFLNSEDDFLLCETLTFHTPSKEFRRKLIQAGGIVLFPEEAETAPESSSHSPIPQRKKIKTSHVTGEPCKGGSGDSSQAAKS
ncbi:protein ENL-like isoform X1 [Xyrichtys novacula]|uniref:Protein ENL-like isoform X1 n=1 Tax=Xyrichtys novacula TaxID=13765 RepID=A0AAV1FIN2_XYRNO|nr:protein ENL-like isoform X1 [Xyrichtys novacula]